MKFPNENSQRLSDKFAEKGLVGKVFKCPMKYTKQVREYIQKIKQANKDAGYSKIPPYAQLYNLNYQI